MEATDVVRLYDMLRQDGITVWIDGGWGVDALLSRQTRSHKDLDLVIQERDVARLRRRLRSQGYRDVRVETAEPHNFVLGDGDGHEVDVHVIVFDADGNGVYGPAEYGEAYPADSLTGEGTIAGRHVRCICPEWMVRFHGGYELKEKDFRDVSALCERFSIELPEAFQVFSG